MKKILCIGEALIDMICTDKGQTLSEGDHFLKKAGGAPTNVAAAIAALGGSVDLITKVGVDPFGKHLEQTLREFGVGTQWVIRDESLFTTFAFVSLMKNGERDFYFNRGADANLNLDEIADLDLDKYCIVHFGSATAFLPGPLQKTYHDLLQKVIQKKIFTSFDPNFRRLLFGDKIKTFKEQSWNFIRNSNFFKVSDEEACLLTDAADVYEAASIFQQNSQAVFAITMGASGSLLGIKGKTTLIPTIPVNVVDTTGAGDAFAGAILFQLQKEYEEVIQKEGPSIEEWKQIIANANKAGARTCEWMGAMEAFRHLNTEILHK